MERSHAASTADVALDWARLARLPFHLVGIAPLLVGHVWVTRGGERASLGLSALAVIAVVLIMLSTYLAGEYFDQREDALSLRYGKSRFAGGSSAMFSGRVKPYQVLLGANLSALAAAAVGIFLWRRYETGPWTIPLGAFGLLSGYFYSTPPLRLVKRGVGELLIGLCYGYLPIFAIAYLQTGRFDPRLFLVATPIAISIFLVIFINEFPDFRADLEAGKRNLAGRLGLRRAAWLYAAFQGAFFASVFALYALAIVRSAWLALPAALSAILAVAVASRHYEHPARLEAICGLTILLNLGTSAVLIAALW